ncbi:MAG: hypothetical protein SGPRY_012905, partial [Prymnesium sp.]
PSFYQIAAIDNVTRKLLREDKPSLLVGFFFSLGHSTVVTIMTLVAMLSRSFVEEHLEATSEVGALIGTVVSASLLLLIGTINLLSAVEIVRRRRNRRASAPRNEAADIRSIPIEFKTVDPPPSPDGAVVGGIVTRCCPAVLNSVHSEGRMFGVGFLFGLGFETSSEVALLALATMTPSSRTPAMFSLLLPAFFAVGSAQLTTCLCFFFMLIRTLYLRMSRDGGRDCYNLFLTSISSVIAIVIGVIEVLGCVQHELQLKGPFWGGVEAVNDNFEYVGYSIIGLFALSGIVAVALWAVRGH